MKLKQLVVKYGKYYLLICGVLTHVAAVYLVSEIAIDRLAGNWRVKALVRWVSGPLDDASLYAVPRGNLGQPDYSQMPKGRWLKIHQQQPNDKVHFSRQRHSGSAWDSRRRRFIIFGSDTHGENWDNSIYSFSLDQLRWQRSYEPDSVETYRVNDAGFPVAGSAGAVNPWVMHTFDAINYLPESDTLVVASYPKHLSPGRFGDWLKDIWGDVEKHPTWIYDFASKRWSAVTSKAVHFFPYATAYDSDREKIVGFLPNGIFEFHSDNQRWKKVGSKSVYAYHTQAVYDNKNRAFIIFGHNNKSNALHVYRAGEKKSREMATKGLRPPGSQHMPFAFDSKLGKAIAIIDVTDQGRQLAQTWLYDLAVDKWERAQKSDFPFQLGMNYQMQYSEADDLLILCASAPNEPPSIWVLRL